ncbi:Zinc finger, BED-type [Dillenia turbinata]|uniref:Zinc finger, BED-type n=1 Tax=Dillenia turbinata TaxID=194707 RepID=A0AAN8VKK8_9MAGN
MLPQEYTPIKCEIAQSQRMSMASSSTPADAEDGVNEYEIVKRPRRTSKVWEEFEMLVKGNKDDSKAQCKHCRLIFSATPKNGTSHLKRHLDRCPKRVNHDLVLASDIVNNAGSPLRNYKFELDECHKALAIFLVDGMLPFTTVELHGFRYLMHAFSPQFADTNKSMAERDVMALYGRERDIVKDLLLKAPGRVSLTIDSWFCEHTQEEYMCITAHWTDVNWKLLKRVIRFKVLPTPCSGIIVADEVLMCLAQWNIENKIFSVTLDDASYSDVMISSLKRRFLGKKFLHCDGVLFQVRCCSHILKLIVKASLDLVEGIVTKIRSGIVYFKRSSSKRRKFYEIAEKSFQLNTRRKLRMDMPFRWDSTFEMLDSALYYKEVWWQWWEQDRGFQNCILSDEEWEKVALINSFLKVFYDVTCILLSSKYPVPSLYFKGIWKIHAKLQELSKGPQNFLSGMIKEMHEKFNRYWSDHSLILSCAAILDPRFKVRFVEYCHFKLYGEGAQEIVKNVLHTIHKFLDEYKKESLPMPQAGTSSTDANVGSGSSFLDEFEDYARFLSKNSRQQTEKSQLDFYLEEPTNKLGTLQSSYSIRIIGSPPTCQEDESFSSSDDEDDDDDQDGHMDDHKEVPIPTSGFFSPVFKREGDAQT